MIEELCKTDGIIIYSIFFIKLKHDLLHHIVASILFYQVVAQTARAILLRDYRFKTTVVAFAQKPDNNSVLLQKQFADQITVALEDTNAIRISFENLKHLQEKAQAYLLLRNKSVKQIAYLVGYKQRERITTFG